MNPTCRVLLRFKAVFQTLLGSPYATLRSLHFFPGGKLSADACGQTQCSARSSSPCPAPPTSACLHIITIVLPLHHQPVHAFTSSPSSFPCTTNQCMPSHNHHRPSPAPPTSACLHIITTVLPLHHQPVHAFT